MKVLLLTALLAAGAYAECANGCSGHGFCGVQDKCSCFRNYQGNDCSMRTCPYDIAYVDLPLGDLDMSGELGPEPVAMGSHTNLIYGNEVWPTEPAAKRAGSTMYDQTEDGHFYAECSNKGICDRKAGTCDCMDGFEGTACRRTACPENCSGHGTCETMQGMAENRMTKGASGKYCEGGALSPKSFSGSLRTDGAQLYNDDLGHLCATEYTLWDRYKAQVCKCDPGYFGIDCSARHCPHGDDPLTVNQVDETQWIDIWASNTLTGSFRLTFEDEFGETWDTMPISYGANTGFTYHSSGTSHADNIALASRIEAALEGIPNGTIQDVTVSVHVADKPVPGQVKSTANDGTAYTYTINTTDGKIGRALGANATGGAAIFGPINGISGNTGLSWRITNCKEANSQIAYSDSDTLVVAQAGNNNSVTAVVNQNMDTALVNEAFCRAPKYGFRIKVQFHKNPGDIHTLGVDFSGTVTGDGLAAHYSSGDILRYIGPIGHGDSAGGTKKEIYPPTTYLTHLGAGDRVLVSGKVASDASGATPDASMIMTVASVADFDEVDATSADATVAAITMVEDGIWAGALAASGMNAAADVNRVWGLVGRGTTENVECSHRGLCNHDDGLCECFAGYSNDDCGTQNALNA